MYWKKMTSQLAQALSRGGGRLVGRDGRQAGGQAGGQANRQLHNTPDSGRPRHPEALARWPGAADKATARP